MPPQTEEFLGKRVWPDDLPPRSFWLRYGRSVAPIDKELRKAIKKQARRYRMLEYWYLPRGYILFKNKNGTLALYETRARTDHEKHINAWAEFARGTWLDTVPTQEGVYPVRDKQGSRREDRKIVEYAGQLVDVSGGFVPPGQVTSWTGAWWSLPYPPLPGAV